MEFKTFTPSTSLWSAHKSSQCSGKCHYCEDDRFAKAYPRYKSHLSFSHKKTSGGRPFIGFLREFKAGYQNRKEIRSELSHAYWLRKQAAWDVFYRTMNIRKTGWKPNWGTNG